MSLKKTELTENNNSQLQNQLQDNVNNNFQYIYDNSEQIKLQNKKYKYNYSNNNISNTKEDISKVKKNDKTKNINIKCIKPKNMDISPNNNFSASHSQINCETKYNINKMTNTYYVNGLNEIISKKNKERAPDLRFISYENKDIYEKKRYSFNEGNKSFFAKNNNIKLNSKDEKKLNNDMKNNYLVTNKNLNNKKNNIIMNMKLNENSLEENIIKTNNHNFKSISNCSSREKKINKKHLTRKYKCDIKIHNINEQQKDNLRTFSCGNSVNKRSTTNTKVFLSDHSKAYENLEYEFNRHKSFDNRYLKMQNSQNMQILQKERLYQILIPIPPNEIDNICNFQIPSKIEKNNLFKEDELKIKNNEIISENGIYPRKKRNNYYYKKSLYINNTNRAKINSFKIKDDLNIETFSLNFEDNGRKFKGEMIVENSDLSYERSPRKWNDDLQPRSNEPLSIEREKNNKAILSETSVEKLTYKGNIKNKKDINNWNQINNKEKVENINLIGERPNKILSKQNKELFSIEGQEKHWNEKILKQVQNTFLINPNVNKSKEEIGENEEKTIINDDEIVKDLKRNIKYNITKEIKNGVDISESSSEYDILKRINSCNNKKYENIIKKSFESNGKDRRIIINDNNQKNEINKNGFYTKKVIQNNNDNNLKEELQEPEFIINPRFRIDKQSENIEYIYRQSITNKKIWNKKSEKIKLNKEDNYDNTNDMEGLTSETKVITELSSNLEESPSHSYEFPTPTSNMRCEYREEINSLSPKYMDKNGQIPQVKNNNENEKSTDNINYMEEEYKNYISNIENSEMKESKVVDEKEINEIESIDKSNSIKEKDKYNNNYNSQKTQIQYICKKKTNKVDKNKNKLIIKKITNNDNTQNNEVNNQENQNNNLILHNLNKKEVLRNEIEHEENYPPGEKSYLNEEENNFKKPKYENLNNIHVNNRENNTNCLKKLNIYNSQKVTKNNAINDSKESGLHLSKRFSKSKILKNDDDKTKSEFGNNAQINLGNIVINNTLKRPKKNNKKKENNHDEEGLIHHFENTNNIVSTNKNNNNDFQNQYSHLNSKIRILKK